MLVIGKKLKVKDYQFKIGSINENVNVFACFKYHGNQYAIYQDINNKKLLYYGTMHISNNILVVLGMGRNDDVQCVKDFVTKLYSGQDLSDYQIIPLDSVSKIEIISYSSFELLDSVMKKLEELTIPKDPELEKKKMQAEANGHPVLYVLTFFAVILAIVGFFVYLNRDRLFGHERTVICTKDKARQYNADVVEEIILVFNKSRVLRAYTLYDTFTFDTSKDFDDFYLTGRYYHVFDDIGSENLQISSNEDSRKYRVGYSVTNLQNYSGPREYNQALEYYTTDKFECKEVE